jgi:hypothetical protein
MELMAQPLPEVSDFPENLDLAVIERRSGEQHECNSVTLTHSD